MSASRLKQLQGDMDRAETYTQWSEAAQEHDRLSGKQEWKASLDSNLYDCRLIQKQLMSITAAIESDNHFKLMRKLNEGIHGNLGGMGNGSLYRQAMFGTQKLIEDYIKKITCALDLVAGSADPRLTFSTKLDFFKRASHCFGRPALLLSGGATQGIFHLGVTKALYEQNLLPPVISGSSAGSFVAAVICTHNDGELKSLYSRDSLRIETMKFLGWRNLFKGLPLMDSEHLAGAMLEYVFNMTFEEALKKTGRHLNISISPAKQHHESRMLNAISSPNVHIRKGVMASCAVPGLFSPVTLTQKLGDDGTEPYNASRQWVDGTITDDLPTKRLSRIYGVNYYIASQTNPHIIPFSTEKKGKKSIQGMVVDVLSKTTKKVLSNLLTIGRDRIRSPALGVTLSHVHAMLSQDYGADIVICPPSLFSNPIKLFQDPDEETINAMILKGERATWPRIERIRNCTAISKKLDEILSQLELEEHKKLEE